MELWLGSGVNIWVAWYTYATLAYFLVTVSPGAQNAPRNSGGPLPPLDLPYTSPIPPLYLPYIFPYTSPTPPHLPNTGGLLALPAQRRPRQVRPALHHPTAAGVVHRARHRGSSMVKVLLWRCPRSAPAPPQGAPGGSGWLDTHPGRAQATGCPVTASGARVSRHQGRSVLRH